MEEGNQTNNIPNNSTTITTFACITNYSHPPSSPLTSKPSSSTASFSCTSPLDDNKPPTLSLFPQNSQNLVKAKLTLSLFPELLEDLVRTDPQPSTTSFSCNDDKPRTLSIFPQVSKNLVATKQSTLTLFPELSQNLATTPPSSSSPSTALCLSLPICTSAITSYASGSSPPKRLFNEISNNGTFPVKKSRARKEFLKNNAVRRCLNPPPTGARMKENEEHWITKKLTMSDVNASASRLLLPRQEVLDHVLPFLDPEKRENCQTLSGIKVGVWDMDTESEHTEFVLKKWKPGGFALVTYWISKFVKRRNLQIDDVIALRWDPRNSRFCFRVQRRHQEADV